MASTSGVVRRQVALESGHSRFKLNNPRLKLTRYIATSGGLCIVTDCYGQLCTVVEISSSLVTVPF